jgi:acetyltransferase-like isoleucine patch superfamily enzyme/2-polyprenyl-3-methyl-5-hydroxy-6-metoxy-1,4-benzoquinol methylase
MVELTQRNRFFRNKHKRQRCFVIGNGPSLKTQDLSFLSNELTFVVNAFWKHQIVDQWQPNYYFFADPDFFNDFKISISFFTSLKTRIHHSLFFAPLNASMTIQGHQLLPLDNTYYLDFHDTLWNSPLQHIDLTKQIPGVITVTHLAIMVAIYMGCSPIYLLGCDHDQLSHRGPDRHFYEGLAGLEEHPETKSTLGGFSYKLLLQNQLKVWYGYENLLQYAQLCKIQILNATNGGFLDVFERIRYEDVIAPSKKSIMPPKSEILNQNPERQSNGGMKSNENISDEISKAKDPYDIAYEWGWSQPQLRELIYLCYKTPNFAENARRFYLSAEFHEAVQILSELSKKPVKGVRVLDFACGNGVASYALARMGYSVVGVDSSLGELAGLNAAKKIQGLDSVDFELVHSTGEKIDFPENSFDVIWIREALHHINNLSDLLKEIKRILKPNSILCCLRDVVIWNENQREYFFATHPFNHITKDEGCYYLTEYFSAFEKAGLQIEKVFAPTDSVINTYPSPFTPGISFDENKAKQRQQGYDLFSFFVRKPKIKETRMQTSTFTESHGLKINIGKDVQIIGLQNINIGEGSCIGDNVWLNVCIRDDKIRMKIGNCVLIGRQAVISTAGYLEISDYCVLAPRVFVSDADHVFSDIYQPILQQGTTDNRSVIIEENCWLGMHSVASGNLTIGRGSVIAANAVVTKDVPPFSIMAGVPAKIVKMYNPATKEWERIKDEAHIEQILKIRESVGIPNREEYRKILEKNAHIRYIDPIVAGKGINI